MSRTERTELLIGEEGQQRLKTAKVLVFGCGGVGGFVCEALARAGLGTIDVVDNDVVSESNINRQIIATTSTIGQFKADLMRERILSVNPDCNVKAMKLFYLPEDDESKEIGFEEYNYIIDAIDTVAAKIDIIVRAKESNVPVISSMGTGNKLDNRGFLIEDIEKTSVCPLARVIRKQLKEKGIRGVKVLYSRESPLSVGSRVPGSISYVPSAAGLIIAGEVIRDILKVQ